MTQQIINVGAAPNDGTGDPARTAFTKCNDNFTELYQLAPQCGRLAYVSATALSFLPYHGDRIRIAGTVYAIPSGGIAGLANTGVFVNGVGGQNLANLTNYYVYAFNNNGTITADFSTTTHATSATALNVGVEIKSGDNTRTLLGLIRTNASGQFVSSALARQVISWFNRRNLALAGSSVSGSTASATAVEVATGAQTYFLTWAEEAVHVSVDGSFSQTAISTVNYAVYLDSAGPALNTASSGTLPAAGYFMPLSASGSIAPSEGFHWITLYGWTPAGTASFSFNMAGMIRG